MCQSFETFGIDLLFGCCQKSSKRPKDPDVTAKRKGKTSRTEP